MTYAERIRTWPTCTLLLLALLSIACGDDSEPGNEVHDAAPDALSSCPAGGGPQPTELSACTEPGLACDVGTLSCWKKLTCEADLKWHVTCGIIFPDGGPCC
jgi:hypothetical protein